MSNAKLSQLNPFEPFSIVTVIVTDNLGNLQRFEKATIAEVPATADLVAEALVIIAENLK